MGGKGDARVTSKNIFRNYGVQCNQDQMGDIGGGWVGENNEEQGSDKAALAAWPRYLSPSASLSELLLLLEDDAQIMMI